MGDDGYDVDCSELHGGSDLLMRIVGGVEDHGMGDAAGEGGQYGHVLLHQAVAAFCAAINAGIAALRAEAEQTSAGLAATAAAYEEDDASVRERLVDVHG